MMRKPYSVKDFMTRSLISFAPETSVYDAMKTLIEHRISGGPVLDSDGNLVGMLSEVDCHKTILSSSYNNYPIETVGDVMSTDLKTVDANMSIHALAEKFLRNPYRRYPVLENGKLIGQISRRDVLIAIQRLREENNIT